MHKFSNLHIIISITYHKYIPTCALLNNLPLIIYPVLEVYAILFFNSGLGEGVVLNAYCKFGSYYCPVGSNYLIPYL